jgi:hypothetical protein
MKENILCPTFNINLVSFRIRYVFYDYNMKMSDPDVSQNQNELS